MHRYWLAAAIRRHPRGPPVGPNPTVLEIRGLPEEPFRPGAVVQLTAWATFSDGTSQQVDPVWGSSTPAVASVDQNGFLFAHAGGETRITPSWGPPLPRRESASRRRIRTSTT